MRLFSSPTSPFARKIRIVAIERGLADAITIVDVDPQGDDTVELHRINPLGRVPTLVLSDGTTLFDSRVIAEYLDALGDGALLLPVRGVSRWRVLRVAALAEGIMDAAFSLVMDRRRPERERSKYWQLRWTDGILRSVAAAEPGPAEEFNLGSVGLACALGYLDFRLPDLSWRSHAPDLARWWAVIERRSSVAQTTPVAA